MLSGRGERPPPSCPLARASAGKNPSWPQFGKLLYEPCVWPGHSGTRIIKNSGSSKRSGVFGRLRPRLPGPCESSDEAYDSGKVPGENPCTPSAGRHRTAAGGIEFERDLSVWLAEAVLDARSSIGPKFLKNDVPLLYVVALRGRFPDRVRRSSPAGKPKNGRAARYSGYLAYICANL